MFHETGTISVGIYLITLVWIIAKNYAKFKPSITRKNIIIFLIIIFPYLVLLKPQLFVSGFVFHIYSLFEDSLGGGFRLWFLNNYTSGKVNSSWPGFSFVIYYALNGVLIIFSAVYLLFLNRKSFSFYYLFPSMIAIIVYFTIAEVLPRAGIFLLPDRAIVQLFYYSVFIILLIVFMKKDISIKTNISKALICLLAVNLFGSLLSSFYLTMYSGSLASRNEKASITAIRNIENNAVILSSQPLNETLVEIYGNRNFITVNLPSEFRETNATIDIISQYINEKIDKKLIQYSNWSYPSTSEFEYNQKQS
jgi:hypothetical protein